MVKQFSAKRGLKRHKKPDNFESVGCAGKKQHVVEEVDPQRFSESDDNGSDGAADEVTNYEESTTYEKLMSRLSERLVVDVSHKRKKREESKNDTNEETDDSESVGQSDEEEVDKANDGESDNDSETIESDEEDESDVPGHSIDTSSFSKHVGHELSKAEAESLTQKKRKYGWEVPPIDMPNCRWVGTGECFMEVSQRPKRKAQEKSEPPPSREKKGKSKKASTSKEERFINNEAQEKFEAYARRKFLYQRMLSLEEPSSQPFREQVEARGWQKLVSPRLSVNQTWVQEFYANLNIIMERDGEAIVSKVRGRDIDFSPENLRVLLEIDNDGADTRLLISNDLSEIAADISPPGVNPVWMDTRGNKLLQSSILTDELGVWNILLHHNIQPSRRSHQLTKDRVDTIYRIASRTSVNVGYLIWKNIQDAGTHASRNMIFPQLINQLCSKAGVTAYESDVWVESDETDITLEHFQRRRKVSEVRKSTMARQRRVREAAHNEEDIIAEEWSGNDEAPVYEEFEEEIMQKGDTTKKGFHGAFNGLLSKVKGMFADLQGMMCRKMNEAEMVHAKRHNELHQKYKKIQQQCSKQMRQLKNLTEKVESLERRSFEAHAFHHYSANIPLTSNMPSVPPFMDLFMASILRAAIRA